MRITAKAQDRVLFLCCAVFNGLCAWRYLLRGDYFFKQADQFYYLSLADSYLSEGKLLDWTRGISTLPKTATSGAALVMVGVIKTLHRLGMSASFDSIAISVVLLYLLLALASYYPLSQLLRLFRIPDFERRAVLLLTFLSFPVTMFRLWPINEGPSLALVAFLLYFLFSPGNIFGVSLASAVASIFRPHVFFIEAVALIFSAGKKDSALFRKTLLALTASVIALLLWKVWFPFDQQALAGNVTTLTNTALLLFSSVSSLMVSESLWSYLFKSRSLVISAICGISAAAALGHIFYHKIRGMRGERRSLFVFSGLALAVSMAALLFSTVITARFLDWAWLFTSILLVLGLREYSKSTVVGVCGGLVLLNLVMLALFFGSHTTNPDAPVFESMKRLAAQRSSQSALVGVEGDLPVKARQVYGYFRLPLVDLSQGVPRVPFSYVASLKLTPGSAFHGCIWDRKVDGTLALFNVLCPAVRN